MQTIEHMLTDYQQFTRPAESSLHMLYYDNTPRSCLLILPGGGYEHLAIFKEEIAIQQWAHSNHLHAALFAYQIEGPYAHQGSAQHFFGTTYSEKQANFFSSINGLPISPPPCFIWHTYGDQSVPIENSQALAEALTEKKGMVELHFFPKGKHGLAMTNQDPFIQQWIFLAESWINRLLKRKEEKNND